jgi:hypothetical protein
MQVRPRSIKDRHVEHYHLQYRFIISLDSTAIYLIMMIIEMGLDTNRKHTVINSLVS